MSDEQSSLVKTWRNPWIRRRRRRRHTLADKNSCILEFSNLSVNKIARENIGQFSTSRQPIFCGPKSADLSPKKKSVVWHRL